MQQVKDLIPNDEIEKLEHKEILKVLKIMETIELLEAEIQVFLMKGN